MSFYFHFTCRPSALAAALERHVPEHLHAMVEDVAGEAPGGPPEWAREGDLGWIMRVTGQGHVPAQVTPHSITQGRVEVVVDYAWAN